MEDQIGRFFEDVNKPIQIFFLGDHDASGHVIEEDIHHRVQTAAGVTFRMKRLAIHAADIKLFSLPPQAIKTTDSRAASFRHRFGNDAATVELDALPATELRWRVGDAVRSLIDMDRWQRQLYVQRVELDCIADFATRMRNLPQIGGNQ